MGEKPQIRRRSPSASMLSKNAAASPWATGSSIARSSRSIRPSSSDETGAGSPKRGPMCARSAPATKATRRFCAAAVSATASRKRATDRSLSGRFPRASASWAKLARIGTMVKSRRPPKRYWRNTAWNSIECSPRWPSSAAKQSWRARATSASTKSWSVTAAPRARVDAREASREARCVEGAVLVETRDDALELGRRHDLAVLAHHGGLDVDHRVVAVEEGDDLEKRSGQQDDGRRVAGGIAQRDHALPLVLDGKRLHRAEPGQDVAHRSRPRTFDGRGPSSPLTFDGR